MSPPPSYREAGGEPMDSQSNRESPRRRPPDPWRRGYVQVMVAVLLLGGVLAMRRVAPIGPAFASGVTRVTRWTWPPSSALAAAVRFAGRRSWGTVVDVWTAALPATGPVTPVPDGRVVAAYGWRAVGHGYRFEPGTVIRGPVGGPVLASVGGTVVRQAGTLWVVVSPALRLGYRGLTGVAVPAGARVAPGMVLGHNPGTITVLMWEAGYPVNPAATRYLGPLGRR